jgi:hypothetical protein
LVLLRTLAPLPGTEITFLGEGSYSNYRTLLAQSHDQVYLSWNLDGVKIQFAEHAG